MNLREVLVFLTLFVHISTGNDAFHRIAEHSDTQDTHPASRAVTSLSAGTPVPASKYPFLAVIQFGPGLIACPIVNNYFCLIVGIGAKVIAPDLYSFCHVYTGVEDFSNIDTNTAKEYFITSIVAHTQYDGTKLAYQIGAVKVCPRFETDFVKLPPANAVVPEATVITAVMYNKEADENGKKLLREVQVAVLSDAACAAGAGDQFVAGKTVCTKSTADDGGVVNMHSMMIYQGVVYGHAYILKPDVNVVAYQTFSHALDWITANTVPL